MQRAHPTHSPLTHPTQSYLVLRFVVTVLARAVHALRFLILCKMRGVRTQYRTHAAWRRRLRREPH